MIGRGRPRSSQKPWGSPDYTGDQKLAQRRHPSPPRGTQEAPATARVAGVRRDCTCKRARHQHGTREAYQNDKCSCLECRAAWTRYIKQWKHRRNSGPTMLPSRVYILKLQSLSALGYSERMLAEEMGISRSTFRMIMKSERILIRTARLIDRTYSRLQMVVPPEGKATRQAKARAVRLGMLPPLAYDEDMTPVAVRDGKYDWQSDLEFLLSCGESEEQALKKLGRTKDALDKRREGRAA